MSDHLGDKFPEIENILIQHIGRGHYDELLRPCFTSNIRGREERGEYGDENPHMACAYFIALISHHDTLAAEVYRAFYIHDLLPLCEWRGLYSRQPFRKNKYPINHPEYKAGNVWNYISKDELTGIACACEGEGPARKIIEHLKSHKNTYDDYTGEINYRLWQNPASMYIYKRAAWLKPSKLEAAWYYWNLLFAKATDHHDSICKSFIREMVMGEYEYDLAAYQRSFMFYFGKDHHFTNLINKIESI